MNPVLLLLADGFEEIEALTVVDVLRRLGLEVITASIADTFIVKGAHQVAVQADALLGDVAGKDFQAVILPGGMPGAKNLYDSDLVLECILRNYRLNAVVGAICAAPIVLERAGLLMGNRKFTAYPGFETFFGGALPSGNPVETDGRIITGKGPGATFAFAAAIAGALGLQQEVKELYGNMFVRS